MLSSVLNPKYICSFLWVTSSLVLMLLGRVFFAEGPGYEGGIYYILFTIVYVLLCFLIKHFIAVEKFVLPWWAFGIGVCFLLLSDPLYENDHYRYLWEGRVLLNAENPYVHSPDSDHLEGIAYEMKDRVMFGHLTTVYPPLGLVWFATVSSLPFKLALGMLMILNAVLCFFFLKLMHRAHVPPYLLILVFPYLQKEFIQAVHLDLFAVSFLVLALVNLKIEVFGKLKGLGAILSFILLSFWSKILGILVLPFVLFHFDKKESLKARNLLLTVFIPLSLGIFFFAILSGEWTFSGGRAFSSDWAWNPGFFSILENCFNVDFYLARKLSFCAFIVYGILVFLRYLYTKSKNPLFYLYESLFLLYAGLMFFSPVYNGWYAIWFLPFALLTKNTCGVLYAVFTSFAYISYGHEEWYYYGAICSHLWFLIAWVIIFFSRRSERVAESKFSTS